MDYSISLPLFPAPPSKSFHVPPPQSTVKFQQLKSPNTISLPAQSPTGNCHVSENRLRRVVVSDPVIRTTARARTPPRDNCRTLEDMLRDRSLTDAQNSQRPPKDPSTHHPEHITPRPQRPASTGHDAPPRSRTEAPTSRAVALFSQRRTTLAPPYLHRPSRARGSHTRSDKRRYGRRGRGTWIARAVMQRDGVATG